MKKLFLILLSVSLLVAVSYAQEETAAEEAAAAEEVVEEAVVEEAAVEEAVVEEAVEEGEMEEDVLAEAEEGEEEVMVEKASCRKVNVGLGVGVPMMIISSNDDNLGYEAGMAFGVNVSVSGLLNVAGIAVKPGLYIGQSSLAKGASAESESGIEVAVLAELEYSLGMVTDGLSVSAVVGAGKFVAVGVTGGLNVNYALDSMVGQPVGVSLGYGFNFGDDEGTATMIDGLNLGVSYGIAF